MTDQEGGVSAAVSAPSADIKTSEVKDSAQPVESKPELTVEQRLEAAEKKAAALELRTSRQTAANRQAQRERDEARQELMKLKPKDDSPKPPREEDFNGNTEEYLKALGRFEATQEFTAKQQAEREQAEQRQVEEHVTKARTDFEAKEATYRETNPDYDETVQIVNEELATIPDGIGKQAFGQALLESESGPAILHHLGKNPQLIEDWKKLSAVGVVRELTKLEMQLSSEPKKRVEPTKKPIDPIKGSGRGSKTLNEKSAKELVEWVG